MKTNNYKDIIEEYSSEYYFLYTGKEDDSDIEQWKNADIAKNYLDKYLLNDTEYEQEWIHLQRQLYSSLALTFPDINFPKADHIFFRVGGATLTKQTFEETQRLMNNTGEKYFVLIQNDFVEESKKTSLNLKMKFPVSATWADLMSGGFISTVLFEMWHNDYFIFGSSSSWARYIANDYKLPVDLLAVNNSLTGIIQSDFQNSEIDHQELQKIIPETYKNIYELNY